MYAVEIKGNVLDICQRLNLNAYG